MSENSSERLSFMLFVGLAVHALLILGVGATISKSNKVAPTLNVTLATHTSIEEPDKADFLAQNNQQASGSGEKIKELLTNEYAEVSADQIKRTNPNQNQSKQLDAQRNEQRVTTKAASAKKITQQKDDKADAPPQQGEDIHHTPLEENAVYASKQAKLDRLKQREAKRPRVTRHTSVSTKKSYEAAYYNHWSEKIIRFGNRNFPDEARRQKIYGLATLVTRLKPDGSVESVVVSKSSGHAILDAAALRSVRMSAPYDAFPPELRKEADVFEISRTWRFDITGLSIE